MGNPHALSRRAGVVDVLAGAAGALLLNDRAMIIELQGHAHDIVAGPMKQGGRYRGVDSARHRRQHPRSGRKSDGLNRERLCGARAFQQAHELAPVPSPPP